MPLRHFSSDRGRFLAGAPRRHIAPIPAAGHAQPAEAASMQGLSSNTSIDTRPTDTDPGDAPHDVAPEIINRILGGDRDALAELFLQYRPRLWRMVNFRLHPKLQGRVDPDDVLQDAWLNAVDRIAHFLSAATSSPFIWFRMIVNQTLIELHRRHIGAEKRNAARECSIHGGWAADSTSSSLAFHLLGKLPSPSSAVHRAELARQLDVALQGMNDIDREVLTLRHFEELTNSETARVLNMSEQAASARYIRALHRLKQILELIPDLATDRRK